MNGDPTMLAPPTAVDPRMLGDTGMPATMPPPMSPDMLGGMPTGGEPTEPGVDDLPVSGGMFETAGSTDMMFEDYFPQIDLTPEDEESIAAWFDTDLRSCVRNVNNQKQRWAMYRAAYMLEYVEKFWPSMGMETGFSSGLLLEKVLEGMDRMKRAVYSARPLFVPDMKMMGVNDIDFFNRAQWFLHSAMESDLEIQEVIGDEGMFDFLVDGSLILEADTMYEKVPQRTLRTYADAEAILNDADKFIDQTAVDRALNDVQNGKTARAVVEENTITKNGLQMFRVDKVDHLVPEGVYEDRGMKFRARRMYLTHSDLQLLASKEVGWYKQEAVDAVIGTRNEMRGAILNAEKDDRAREQLSSMEKNYDLMYPFRDENEDLGVMPGTQPYREVVAVYRVTCKYGYSTKGDPKGDIPKYCVFDYSPEGRKILRAQTYPHFEERPSWFHLKMGFAPKSYYGFGYGPRLIKDDILESSAIDLFLEGSALAMFRAFLCKHPDAGGTVPFLGGYGPAKIGYVMDMNDFKPVDVSPPPEALLRHLLPLTQTRASNRTNVTSLTQGRGESSDPRSPAQKTAMLLAEASVGFDIMVTDWNKGWSKIANYVWTALYENSVFWDGSGELAQVCGGRVVRSSGEIVRDDQVTMDELSHKIMWKSQASVAYLNPEVRVDRFLKSFSFFMPMIDRLAQLQPSLYKKYFIRWVRRAAQEMDLSGFDILIPTDKEVEGMPVEQLQGMMQNMRNMVQSGNAPGMVNIKPPELGPFSATAGGEQ